MPTSGGAAFEAASWVGGSASTELVSFGLWFGGALWGCASRAGAPAIPLPWPLSACSVSFLCLVYLSCVSHRILCGSFVVYLTHCMSVMPNINPLVFDTLLALVTSYPYRSFYQIYTVLVIYPALCC